MKSNLNKGEFKMKSFTEFEKEWKGNLNHDMLIYMYSAYLQGILDGQKMREPNPLQPFSPIIPSFPQPLNPYYEQPLTKTISGSKITLSNNGESNV